MSRQLSIYAALMGVIIMGEVASIATSRHSYRDPFAGYEQIVPGQSSDVLNHYPCSISRDEVSTAHCNLRVAEGAVESVTVVYDDVIQWVHFDIRSDELELGDLILCWGKPTSVEPIHAKAERGPLLVHWGEQRYAVIIEDRYDGHPNYRLPIHEVVIADEWWACQSS